MVSRILACLLFLGILLPAASAQKAGEYMILIPEKLERETKTNEQGLMVWAEFKATPCVNCKGKKTMTCVHCARMEKEWELCPECKRTKTATCRTCFGTGEMYDILLKAPCPSCMGAGLTACFVCNGAGNMMVEGSGKKPTKCGCCKGVGGYKCGTCEGKRFVEHPPIKPPLPDGKSQDVKKTIEAVDAMTAALAKFDSSGDGRKDIKLWTEVLGPGLKTFPAIKRAQAHFEEISKAQGNGSVWKAYADMVKNQAESAKKALEYWLKFEKRVLELCLARAEHNEAQAPKKK